MTLLTVFWLICVAIDAWPLWVGPAAIGGATCLAHATSPRRES